MSFVAHLKDAHFCSLWRCTPFVSALRMLGLLARVVLAPPSKPRPESFELLGTAGLRAEQSGVGRSLEF